MRGHAAVYRMTGGKIGGRLPGLPPLILVEHEGAKTGRRRTSPLVYMPVDENFLIVAAKGGHPRNPGWVHNLRAHPETTVQLGSERIEVRAREVDGAEYDRLWAKATEYNPFWERYRQRTSRKIPLILLERR
jgi:deazaflavin-dependent oxidoreductase (nitroreductase family)